MSLELWKKVVSINLTSVFLLSKYAAIYMKKQKNGTIINISSTAGKKGAPYSSAYCASKSGVTIFSKSLAEEVSQYGINVIVITPSTIKTDFIKKGLLQTHNSIKKYVERKYLNKDGIFQNSLANLIIFFLDLPKGSYIKEVII